MNLLNLKPGFLPLVLIVWLARLLLRLWVLSLSGKAQVSKAIFFNSGPNHLPTYLLLFKLYAFELIALKRFFSRQQCSNFGTNFDWYSLFWRCN